MRPVEAEQRAEVVISSEARSDSLRDRRDDRANGDPIELDAPVARSKDLDEERRELISQGHLLPRRARPPWIQPDVLVLSDDLPTYLKRERGFQLLTRQGLRELSEAPALAKSNHVRRPMVAVSDFHALDDQALDELSTVQRGGIPVFPLEPVLERRCRMHVLRGAAGATTHHSVAEPGPLYRAGKRTIDLVAGVLGSILFLLILPFVALALFIEDRGPALYTQERVGRGSRAFKVLKFRSMRTDAETLGPAWSRSDDERVTRVGMFLRISKIDEIPQFVNVMLGHMSIVGPRPERPFFVHILEKQVPHYGLRHLVRPGMTGWGTIKVGYGNSIEAKLLQHQYDLYHLQKSSLLFDIEVLVRSLTLLVFRANTLDRYML